MAVPEQTPYKEYTANGVTKIFPLEFDVLEQDHLIVLVNDLEPTVGSWSLDAENDTVVFALPPANGANIKIRRDTPLERPNDYGNYNATLKPTTVNTDFDNIWRKLQEMGVLNWMIDNNIKDLNEYVDSLNDETKAIFLQMIQEQGTSLEQLDSYVDQLYKNLAEVAAGNGWFAEFVADGDENQKQINDKSVQFVNTLSDLLNLEARKNGAIANVAEIDSMFVFDASQKDVNNGRTIFNGWVLQLNNEIDLARFPKFAPELDSTGRFLRAVESVEFYSTSSPAEYAVYSMTSLVIPSGVYIISDEIKLPAFLTEVKAKGKAIIKQTNDTKRIFVHDDVWSCDYKNLKFIGGTHQIYLQNDNRDTTIINLDNCEFNWSLDYAVKTWGVGLLDNHLSAKITLNNCKFIKTNGALYNCCDIATINGGWIFPSKENFSADRAVNVNRYGTLQMLNGVLCVPTLGTQANGDRLPRVRWVDNHDRFYADGARFGGENDGIPIVYCQEKAAWLDQNMGNSVIIKNSMTYAGLRYRYGDEGATVVYFDKGIPFQVVLEGNYYQLATPYITANPSLNIDTFFDSDNESHLKYKYSIESNMTWGESAYQSAFPQAIRRFVNTGKLNQNIYPIEIFSSGITSEGNNRFTFALDKSVNAFSYLVTVAGNTNPNGSNKYRKVITFVLNMTTEFDGTKIVNYLSSQILSNPNIGNTGTPNLGIVSTHFGQANTGSTSREADSGGYVSFVINNISAYAKASIVPILNG